MMAKGPHGQQFEAYRPVIMGRNGMVCSGHTLASEAGIWTMRRGGNAMDAAISTAAALGIVEPQNSGVGGDGFIMVYRRAHGDSPAEMKIVNATGAAPAAATREAYRDGIPMKGIRSVSIPGLVDGWLQAHARYGRLKLSSCFEPAIDLAQNGFPVSHVLAAAIYGEPALMQFPGSAAIFGRDGRPLRPGEIAFNRDLANTLRRIAIDGRGALYEGEIAQAIEKASRKYNGLITAADLASHHAEWQDPISTTYRGFKVMESPPNSSGHILLQELNLIERFDIKNIGCNSAEAIHLMVEAKRLAFADREAYMADPRSIDVPIEGLLSKNYADERAQLIDMHRAAENVSAGNPWPYTGRTQPASVRRRSSESDHDTTCFAVVDSDGNAVCQIQSIQGSMGSGLVAEGTGILLNNRMTYWHLEPDHVDCLEPGKRVRHTMNTVMVFKDDELYMVHGTPGADTQVQTNLQVLTHVIDHGMTVNEAVEAPRWRHIGRGTESTVPHGEADALNLEGRIPTEVADELSRRGHPVARIGDWEGAGNEVAIRVDAATGALQGACDPRRDGYAVGY